MVIKRGWWELKAEYRDFSRLDECDREHIAEMIKDGYTSGELVRETDDNCCPHCHSSAEQCIPNVVLNHADTYGSEHSKFNCDVCGKLIQACFSRTVGVSDMREATGESDFFQ